MWEFFLWRGGDSKQSPLIYDFDTIDTKECIKTFNTALEHYYNALEVFLEAEGNGYVYEPYLVFMQINPGSKPDVELKVDQWLLNKDIPVEIEVLKALTECVKSIRFKNRTRLDIIQVFGPLQAEDKEDLYIPF